MAADINQLIEQMAQALQSIDASLKTIATALQNTAVDTDLQGLNRIMSEIAERIPTP